VDGQRWCQSCQQKVSLMNGPICQRCGDKSDEEICPNCQQRPPAYIKLRSFASFEGTIRNALHRLKYKSDIGLGEALSKHLIELYNRERWIVDFIMPVPLGQRRLKQRGFNQAGLLARPMAYATNIPYRADLLIKRRETPSQVGLSASERAQNVTGAFFCKSPIVSGKSILIIDDVTTTGSTINACAQALCEAGAAAVYGLTLARALLQADVDDQSQTIS